MPPCLFATQYGDRQRRAWLRCAHAAFLSSEWSGLMRAVAKIVLWVLDGVYDLLTVGLLYSDTDIAIRANPLPVFAALQSRVRHFERTFEQVE